MRKCYQKKREPQNEKKREVKGSSKKGEQGKKKGGYHIARQQKIEGGEERKITLCKNQPKKQTKTGEKGLAKERP